ncbi:MAG: S49 family peptidase [Burkholderiales bacterium]|nr:S49 family peptidase [Burkholderiales bacterium]
MPQDSLRNDAPASPGWERSVLEKVALASLQEQRRARRWGIFFKLLGFIYLFALLFVALGWLGKRDGVSPAKHTAVVEIRGVIAPDHPGAADNITTGLQEAFKDKNTQGVVLRINSPGGSPVQAGQINDEIRRLRAKYPNTPLYAVVEDICASGGYYVAAATDKIFVNESSIVGSIGVLMDGFGFSSVLDKLGVERRLMTAGENKGFLDPFLPLDPQQRQHAQNMLDAIHTQFIKVVREGRGERLKDVPELFTGLMWTGQKSIDLGLADALGSVEYVAREIIKAEDLVDYTPRENIAERVAKRFGAAMAETLLRAGAASGGITLR